MIANKLRVAFLSSFTPRECGIATFTRDLVDSIHRERTLNHSVAVAVNKKGAHYNYDHRVKFQIKFLNTVGSCNHSIYLRSKRASENSLLNNIRD